MNHPRNTREALIAEMLGDIDGLLQRVDALPPIVANLETTLSATRDALTNAGDKYRLAVTSFTEQAKLEVTDYLQRKASQVAAQTVDEQRALMVDAARSALRSEASALAHAAQEFRRSARTRMLEHLFTAALASAFTAGMVIAFH